MKAKTLGVILALTTCAAVPAIAQQTNNVPDPNGPTSAAQSSTAMQTMDHMSSSQMSAMKRCQAMSSDAMMKNKKCAAMAKSHPEMMQSGSMGSSN